MVSEAGFDNEPKWLKHNVSGWLYNGCPRFRKSSGSALQSNAVACPFLAHEWWQSIMSIAIKAAQKKVKTNDFQLFGGRCTRTSGLRTIEPGTYETEG